MADDVPQLLARSPSRGDAAPQTLTQHASGVARRAAQFVAEFADPAWGHMLARWHDLGKAAPDWQEFIRSIVANPDEASSRSSGPAHAPLGAIHAAKSNLSPIEKQSATFAIDGHHRGLADHEDLKRRTRDSLHNERYELARARLAVTAPELLAPASPRLPDHLSQRPTPRSLDLFTRFLFSALVDADALDAEEHAGITGDVLSRERTDARGYEWPALSAYEHALDAFMSEKQRLASPTVVNQLRRRVLQECIDTCRQPAGAFSLTVPTGGGKTFASLEFALKHAIAHGCRRVIIAVPFTAIIDQTAQVLRTVFGPLGREVLVEHHSGLEPERESGPGQAAADNWDAPLIITTQVQLFESLFSNRPSKCRKLHNLANSVIILDEVQSLPHGVLAPVLDVLNEMVAYYRVTLLLTTATQPGLHTRSLGGGRFTGFAPKPAEIISDSLARDLWTALRRVDVRWPASAREGGAAPDDFWRGLAAEVAKHRQVLAIVHLKMDARLLWEALTATGAEVFHLSAGMCPVHRRQVLATVRGRLADGSACTLISTQLIEAGVDVDFPVVYRAMAGLESLAQSAGRCNREGKLPGLGSFHVFTPPTRPPSSLQLHLDVATAMLQHDPRLDLFSPDTFVKYFDRLYAARSLDVHTVQPLRAGLRFESTAAAFRMIGDNTQSVVVCWDDNARLLVHELRGRGPSRSLLRHLQPYTVSVFPHQRAALERQSMLEDLNGYLVLRDFTRSPYYHAQLGLLTEADPSVSLVL